MTQPMNSEFPEPEPSDAFQQAENLVNNYGPDHTAVNEEPIKPRFSNLKRERKPKLNIPGNLGNNKKRASGVRALVEADKQKISSLYVAAAMGTMPFNQKLSQALATSADDCADAWFELAREHDGVRKFILAIIEGGAWGKVFAAHMPILLATMPQGFIEQRLGNMFGAFGGLNVPDSPPENGNG